MEWIVVSLASLLAGFVDAIVGGGGLILLPALFATFARCAAGHAAGHEQKCIVLGHGHGHLAVQSPRAGALARHAACSAGRFAGLFMGAWAVTLASPDFLRKLLPLVMCAVLVYTLAKKDLGMHHAPRFAGRQQMLLACAIGFVIGLYDGFWPRHGQFFHLRLCAPAGL